MAEVLASHGISHIFTLPGGHISPILTGAERCGIKVIDTRHEATAAFAADSMARLTGKPGVVVVTAGPGLTNVVTPIKNAQMAESPVLLLGGSTATFLKGRGALQDIDHLSVFRSITKWQKSVRVVRDIVPILREAFYEAQSGTPGPVFVELPLDVLYPYSVVLEQINKKHDDSFVSKLTNWYLNGYLNNLFFAAFDCKDIFPLRPFIPQPKSTDIKEAVELIMNSKRPVLVLGSQAVSSISEGGDLRKFIETLGIPCFLGGMCRGVLGVDHKLHARHDRTRALKEADLVLLAGTGADFRLNYGRSLSRKSKIISINRSRDQLLKNSGMFWNPTIAALSDASSFLCELCAELSSMNHVVSEEWINTLRLRDINKELAIKKLTEVSVEEYLNPMKVLETLNETFSDSTFLVADGGDFVAMAASIVQPRGPIQWCDPGVYGTLGCGAGFALGIKCAKPNSDVVCLFGDGSLGYSLIEFDTFARHKLPIVAIVGNDACWTQVVREQKSMLGSEVGCNLSYTRYDKSVEGLGCVGICIDTKNAYNMKSLFEWALKLTKSERKSVLCNVLIGKTNFRDGSISI